MRACGKWAAFLLPVLSLSLVLPNDHLTVEVLSTPSRSINIPLPLPTESSFEYNHEDNSISFKIPCPGCLEEDRSSVEDRTFSVEISPLEGRGCSIERAGRLQVDGEDILSKEQQVTGPLQRTHGGLLRLPGSTFQRSKNVLTIWNSLCQCVQFGADGQCQDHEYVLRLRILTPGMGIKPGFTLSYRQYDPPKFLKLNQLPDTGSIEDFGPWGHWRSLLPTPSWAPQSTGGLGDASSSAPVSATSRSIVLTSTSFDAPTITSEVSQVSSSPPKEDSTKSPYAGQLSYESPVTAHPYLKVQGNGAWATLKHSLEVVEEHTKHVAHAVAETLFLQQCSKLVHPSAASLPVSPSEKSQPSKVLTIAPPSSTSPSSGITTTTSSPQIHQTSNKNQARRIFQTASLLFIIASLGFALFSLINRNPRLRAELAACREERRNKRLFRHAARRQRIRNCFNRLRGLQVTSPASHTARQSEGFPSQPDINGVDWAAWNEKRLQSCDDDVFGSGTMREELRAMRKAHMVVDGIICAEEGRCQTPVWKAEAEPSKGRAWRRTTRALDAVARLAERRSRRYSDSSGSEKSAPPPYEESPRVEDLEAAVAAVGVADGLRYIPTSTVMVGDGCGRRISPASSVVDTSPRDSLADSDSEPEKE